MTRLTAERVSIDVPDGWDARIFRRSAQPPETTHAVVHAANFALPQGTGDYGDGAVQLMGAQNVLVALVEFHPSSTANALFSAKGWPAPLRPDHLDRTTLQHPIGGQAGAQRFFSIAGRAWSLYVVVGSFDGRASLLAAANDVLSTVTVGP